MHNLSQKNVVPLKQNLPFSNRKHVMLHFILQCIFILKNLVHFNFQNIEKFNNLESIGFQTNQVFQIRLVNIS